MQKSILIDATHFGTKSPTGVEYYTDRILPELSAILSKSGSKVYWVGHTESKPKNAPAEIEWIYSPHRHFWGQLAIPGLMAKLKATSYFTPSGIVPLGGNFKKYMTVHDLAIYHYPEAYSKVDWLRLSILSKKAASKASGLIVPSEFTKNDVVKYWNMLERKVHVINHGYDIENKDVLDKPKSLSGMDKFLNRFEGCAVFTFMGRLETKKNLITVIRAFAKADRSDMVLVLAGNPGHGFSAIQKTIDNLSDKLKERIYLPGYLTREQKNWLYRHSNALLCPCPVEGFGFPALEGMDYKLPVLFANQGSLPEVVGEAGLPAHPFDVSAWAINMREIVDNNDTSANLRDLGLERLKKYNWDNTIKRTAEILNQ